MHVSYGQLLPALISCHATVCVFSPKAAVTEPNEEGAEWSHMADEVRGEMQQLLLVLLIAFNSWQGKLCVDCCCKTLPSFCWRALLSRALQCC